MLNGIYSLFEGIFSFFEMIGNIIVNIISAIVNIFSLLNTGVPIFLNIVLQCPGIIVAAALLGLSIAIANRFSVGIGGG